MYADLPPLDLAALRATTTFAPAEIRVQQWNTEARNEVHGMLVSSGEVRLRFGDSAREAIRAALLDLQTVPVEDSTLLVHPTVVAVLDGDTSPQVWLRLQGWYR